MRLPTSSGLLTLFAIALAGAPTPLAGCARNQATAPPEPSVVAADASAAAPCPAAPARPAVRAVTAAGAPRPLDVDGGANDSVSPEAWFELELPIHPPTPPRVRLFDESGRMVESTDRLEMDRSARYRLKPDAPLLPGSAYELVLDAVRAAAAPLDSAAELRVRFRTSGEKPAPPPRPAARGAGRKHR